MLESLSSVFADISVPQLALMTAMALIASVVGGVAGYGTEMSAKTEDSDSSIGLSLVPTSLIPSGRRCSPIRRRMTKF